MSTITKERIELFIKSPLENGLTRGEQMELARIALASLEAAEKRIAELSHHLRSAHEFIEHTEAFGHEASNGILCCGDAQWNIDASKAALASTGSINGED